jgi:hypothetical protein
MIDPQMVVPNWLASYCKQPARIAAHRSEKPLYNFVKR